MLVFMIQNAYVSANISIFVFEMKRWLKYLLPLAAVVLFWNSMSSDTENAAIGMHTHEASIGLPVSVCDSELCLHIQDDISYFYRVQSSARRIVGMYKNSFTFVRSGKLINVSICYLCLKKSLVLHSSVLRPSDRLLNLGKLII